MRSTRGSATLLAGERRFSEGPGADITIAKGGLERLAKIRIPTPLRKFTGGAEEVAAEGSTVSQIVADMESRYPGIKERLCEPDGRVRRFVNIYVNGDDIRFLQNLDTAVASNDEVSIVPAIAGGF